MLNPSQIRFVLVNTTHPGNIGASARAIKTMGFDKLYLVSPRFFPHPEATARSSGAENILENAIVVPKLTDAIADCHLVLGTSSRGRALPIPMLTPRESAERFCVDLHSGNKIALLFGQERIGLTNDELSLCHFHIYIPCNPQYASLNIASAVQIIAYEFHLHLFKSEFTKEKIPLATSLQLENFYTHLEEILIALDFLKPENPRQMMRKLRRLFGRCGVEENELNILRGVLSAIKKKTTN